MEHTLTTKHNGSKQLSAIDNNNGFCLIRVYTAGADNFEQININKEELHSFIGTLLHIQQKMKGGENGKKLPLL